MTPASERQSVQSRPACAEPLPLAPWPFFDDRTVEAVADTLRSGAVNYWTGKQGKAFEAAFAQAFGSRSAIALANGTLALDLALVGLGIGAGDEVIVTPRSFIASVSCVVNAGAVPVFADVDRDSGNISAATIAACITQRTKAIIPVHIGGWPADMEAICALAAAAGLHVIEDCAQAHGARIGGRHVGTFGVAGAWSFCQDKIMTTGGEGGMVTTDDDALWSRMWSFKDHGKAWDTVHRTDHPPGFRWLHESFGTNWRMTELQSAIGLYQLEQLPDWVQARQRIAAAIRQMLAQFPGAIRCPVPADGIEHAHYRQYAYVRSEGLRPGWSRDRLVAEAVARKISLFHGTCSEIYREKAFDGTPWRPAAPLPVARELGETSLMFLVHPTITQEQLDSHLDAFAEILAEAAR